MTTNEQTEGGNEGGPSIFLSVCLRLDVKESFLGTILVIIIDVGQEDEDQVEKEKQDHEDKCDLVR